jgi:hypothetical protein
MNAAALEVQYTDYQRQMAWINANDWQIERRAKQYPARRIMPQALMALATRLMPATTSRTQVAWDHGATAGAAQWRSCRPRTTSSTSTD